MSCETGTFAWQVQVTVLAELLQMLRKAEKPALFHVIALSMR